MRLEEIKTVYTQKDLVEEAKRDPWGRYCMRPISYHPAWLCIKLGVTANQVTWFSLGVGLSGCILLGFGSYQLMVIGAGLIIVRSWADRVDGAVAKATNTITEYGKRLDILCDLTIQVLLPIAVGIGLYFKTGFILYPILGLVSAGSRIGRHRLSKVSLEPQLRRLYQPGVYIVMFKEPILLVCALANILGIFLTFYTLVDIVRVVGVTRSR